MTASAAALELAEIRGLIITAHASCTPATGTPHERILSRALLAALEVMPEGPAREHARLALAAYADARDLDVPRAPQLSRVRRELLTLVRREEAEA